MTCAALTLAVHVVDAAPSPSPAATPVAASTATPAASPTATPDYSIKATYNGKQQNQYITTAGDAFLALRQVKTQTFAEMRALLGPDGGTSAKGLSSKADIAARRELIAKSQTANDDYMAFIKDQENIYRAELAKTPLVPADVDSVAKEFTEKANTPALIRFREIQQQLLKTADEMMANLDRWYGTWSISNAGRISFKKKGNTNTYIALQEKYNALVTEQLKIKAVINPPPVAAPSATPGAASPGASASPAASVAPVASAKPSAAATPAKQP